jgi:pyruvate dehydrogenase E1 component alpha subunit
MAIDYSTFGQVKPGTRQASRHAHPRRPRPLPLPDAATARDLLARMLLVRRFEEACAERYMTQSIGGFCHLYIGQEAVAVGAISTLRPEDAVLASYREHGHALARGMDPGVAMAELMGRAAGCCRGKGGSMHLFDRSLGFFGGHGIVGGQLPVAVGLAFAAKYQGTGAVTLCFLGDGAVPEGAFHESLNLAALWKLPVVFVIENNRYAMGTPLEKTNAVTDLYEHARAYGLPGEAVDGMDVLAVREATARAVARARLEGVASLLEARTYRYRGHSMSDPAAGTYRTREELEGEKRRDPIAHFRARLVEGKALPEAEAAALDAKARELVARAIAFAEASPAPAIDSLYENVYTS